MSPADFVRSAIAGAESPSGTGPYDEIAIWNVRCPSGTGPNVRPAGAPP